MRRWSYRLAVRTSDSHSGNTGSIPVGTAKIFICREVVNKYFMAGPVESKPCARVRTAGERRTGGRR